MFRRKNRILRRRMIAVFQIALPNGQNDAFMPFVI